VFRLMKIIFIILHYKDSKLTTRCLDSVCRETANGDQVVVIDASHDFKIEGYDYRLIHIRETPQYNPGFARSMNYGAQEAEKFNPDFLCFVNNDAIIAEEFRNETLRAFDKGGLKKVAAVGPKIVYLERPDLIWAADGYVSGFKMTSEQVRQNEVSSSISNFLKTEFLSGCVVTIDALEFKEVGGWPEAYLFGGEDSEISSRFIKKGKTLIVSSDVVVLHDVEFGAGQGKSHSISDMRFILNSYINRILYADRNVSWVRSVIFRGYLAFYILLIMPFRWRQVADAENISKKMRYARELAKYILLRKRKKHVTWSELSDFVSSVTTN